MATTVVLNQATLTVDSVDFSDQVSTITVTESYEALEATAFGDTARKFVKGLGNHEISATLMISYGSSEVEEKLNSLAGTTFNVVVTPTTSRLTIFLMKSSNTAGTTIFWPFMAS